VQEILGVLSLDRYADKRVRMKREVCGVAIVAWVLILGFLRDLRDSVVPSLSRADLAL